MKTNAHSLTVASIVLALIGATVPFKTLAQQAYLTHPSSCVAPFLYQAEGMRWHEHFLLNPSDGVTTWAVCPVNMYFPKFIIPEGDWIVQVFLQDTANASAAEPQCYFTVHSVINQEWGDYISGSAHKATLPLKNLPNGEITVAQGQVKPSDIAKALGAGADEYPFHAAVFCRLDPGWGLNGVELIEVLEQPSMATFNEQEQQ